jgi:hypothetical protein
MEREAATGPFCVFKKKRRPSNALYGPITKSWYQRTKKW